MRTPEIVSSALATVRSGMGEQILASSHHFRKFVAFTLMLSQAPGALADDTSKVAAPNNKTAITHNEENPDIQKLLIEHDEQVKQFVESGMLVNRTSDPRLEIRGEGIHNQNVVELDENGETAEAEPEFELVPVMIDAGVRVEGNSQDMTGRFLLPSPAMGNIVSEVHIFSKGKEIPLDRVNYEIVYSDTDKGNLNENGFFYVDFTDFAENDIDIRVITWLMRKKYPEMSNTEIMKRIEQQAVSPEIFSLQAHGIHEASQIIETDEFFDKKFKGSDIERYFHQLRTGEKPHGNCVQKAGCAVHFSKGDDPQSKPTLIRAEGYVTDPAAVRANGGIHMQVVGFLKNGTWFLANPKTLENVRFNPQNFVITSLGEMYLSDWDNKNTAEGNDNLPPPIGSNIGIYYIDTDGEKIKRDARLSTPEAGKYAKELKALQQNPPKHILQNYNTRVNISKKVHQLHRGR